MAKESKPKQRLGMPTRTAEDWEEAALDAISNGGLGALSIPALAEALGVTKGSFYWHFTGLPALIDGALARWEGHDRAVIEELMKIADPRARLREAFSEVMHMPRAQALFVTLTASPEPRVMAALRRVSARRMRFLVTSYTEMGLSKDEARARALLAYTAYVGALHLRRQSIEELRSARGIDTYAAHAAKVLIPER